MGSNLSTVVVEPRVLDREALKSLMAKSSYCVVYDAGAAAQLSAAVAFEEPKLVILGAPQSADSAVAEAVAIRKMWPDSKIVLLGIARLGGHAAAAMKLPTVEPIVAPILYSVPVQLLAYYTAVAKGTDVDQPRNLAKSVTVE
jgi:glucosamine 6-phosphate synthetase-like amidotransferase/phosphosugar isomerase protein